MDTVHYLLSRRDKTKKFSSLLPRSSSLQTNSIKHLLLSRVPQTAEEGINFSRHVGNSSSTITAIEFIPDSVLTTTSLLSGDSLGNLKFWKSDAFHSLQLQEIAAHNEPNCINKICPSTSSPSFAVAYDDPVINLFSISSSSLDVVHRFDGHQSYVTDLKSHQRHTGLYVSSSLDSTARIWHSSMKNAVFVLKTETSATSACFAQPQHDPYYVVTSTFNALTKQAAVVLWDIRKHRSFVSSVAQPLSKATEEQRYQFDTTERFISQFSNPYDQLGNTFAPTRSFTTSYLFGGSSAFASTHQTTTNDEMKPILSFHCKNLVASSYYDKATASSKIRFTGHKPDNLIYNVSATSCGTYLLTSSADNTHKLWKMDPHSFPASSSSGISAPQEAAGVTSYRGCNNDKCPPKLSSNDKFMYCGGSDGNIYVWETFNSNVQRTSNQYLKIPTAEGSISSNAIRAIALNERDSMIAYSNFKGELKLIAMEDVSSYQTPAASSSMEDVELSECQPTKQRTSLYEMDSILSDSTSSALNESYRRTSTYSVDSVDSQNTDIGSSALNTSRIISLDDEDPVSGSSRNSMNSQDFGSHAPLSPLTPATASTTASIACGVWNQMNILSDDELSDHEVEESQPPRNLPSTSSSSPPPRSSQTSTEKKPPTPLIPKTKMRSRRNRIPLTKQTSVASSSSVKGIGKQSKTVEERAPSSLLASSLKTITTSLPEATGVCKTQVRSRRRRSNENKHNS